MLILTRRIGESIRIGDEISVSVIGINGSQVKVGISAPDSVPVHREEIYDRIAQEREAAGGPDDAGHDID